MKQISIRLILLFSVLSFYSSGFCQRDLNQDRNIYSYQTVHKNHPDGVVSKISAQIEATYSSIKNQPEQPVVDATLLHAQIGWVLSDKFSERQSLAIKKEFETTYQLSVGFSYYLSNPLAKNVQVNPDGKIGSPIISMDAIMLLDNIKETKSTTNFKAEILFPISTSFSILGGVTSYEKISARDVEKIFGGLHFFISSYKLFEKFNNPDSPLDGIAFSIIGGNSNLGSFGKFIITIPSSQSVSIDVSLRGDFLEAPYDKSFSASLQISYYTGK